MPDGRYDWSVSHAQVPKADTISEEAVRIYFGTRDKEIRTVTSFIEVEADNPQHILYVHDRPVLGLGKLGCFDDSGAMPACIVNHDGMKYLYYTGWSRRGTVPYHLSIGLAVSEDGGRSFERLFEGPIIDRSSREPYACAQPCVLKQDNKWRMWYLSFTHWEVIEGKPEPFYHVKYAESSDGIDWTRTGLVCIGYNENTDALANPKVWVEEGRYKMLYAFRKAAGYRTNKEASYRLGYAESEDGIDWVRKDEEVGLDRSEEGWDSEMIAYADLYTHNGDVILLYNGNGFGKSGFGYAVLELGNRFS